MKRKHYRVGQYKKLMAGQGPYPDAIRAGRVSKKYWFSPKGKIFPVEREHGDQALKIARELELISPSKSISDYGYKSTWELARGLFLNKGWLRVQVYGDKTIGLNAKPSALDKKSTEDAVFNVLSSPGGFSFQENWPYTLEYRVSAEDHRKHGWKKALHNARRIANLARRKEEDELLKYRLARE